MATDENVSDTHETERERCARVRPATTDPVLVTREEVVATIAARVLGIVTRDVRNSDSLDFHDIGVVDLREALEAAYDAGREVGA